MAAYIADFHIHSRYSRATSRDCVPEKLDWWARRKGLRLLGTGDFTHPAWRQELRDKLRPAEEGLYTLKEEHRIHSGAPDGEPRFVVTGEISSIYKKGERVRKVHNLILLPGLDEAERLSRRLELIGNLHSDGRPILGLDSRDLLEITLDVCPEAIFIPAHIWTPHFSLFGAYSGFDRIEDCFEDLTPCIHAVETGLSSDPPMNGRLSALDRYHLVSNSDAHSPARLAREANLLDTEMSYAAIKAALDGGAPAGLRGTIEFFPEEGKYHFDGHRNCRVCLDPADTIRAAGICPVCGRRITVGVLHRVEELADRPDAARPGALPYESLVPLDEVIAASTGYGAASGRVQRQYEELLGELGAELSILREAPLADIERQAGPLVAEGIRRLRSGEVERLPGYDGEYGKIRILTPEDIDRLTGQLLFYEGAPAPSVPAKRSKMRAEPATAAKPIPAQTGGDPGLNPEQLEAVNAVERVVAVSAGPGTGKTRTLIRRVAALLEKGVPPEAIAAVTFTNRAAREMRDRLGKEPAFRKAAKKLTIGTFHAICLRLLEKWDGHPPAVLDEGEALLLAEEACRETGWSGTARRLLQEVSAVKNGRATGTLPPEAAESYRLKVQAAGALDYDDLLIETLRRLEADPPAGTVFPHLLVDEFQDVNPLQLRLLRAWNREGESLFVIGDPDQAIYSFRGADAAVFERLEAACPAGRFIRLFRNYRSTPEILACARPVIEADGVPRRLEAQASSGQPVGFLAEEDAFSEALFVTKEINRLVGGIDMLDASAPGGGKGRIRPGRRETVRGLSEIAVLYRTHRQAELFEYCFQKEGIPYTVAGREDYLADGEVRRALAFLRLLSDPADNLALRRLLGHPLPEDWTPAGSAEGLAARLEELPEGGALAEKLRGAAGDKPQALLEAWLEGQPVTGPLERLLSAAALYDKAADFLWDMSLGREGDVARCSGRQYTPDAVSLMTLHASKGLEFPVVFLCGVEKGKLPLTGGRTPADPAEERRLFYVGMTRAREELVLLAGGEPSEFLADIPPERLENRRSVRRSFTGRQLSLFE